MPHVLAPRADRPHQRVPATFLSIAYESHCLSRRVLTYSRTSSFRTLQGWAEGSLIMAENVVTQLGAAAPTFISPERHACVVYDTYNYNASLCALSLNPIFQGTQRRLISLDDAATEVAATAAEAGSMGAVGGRRWRM